MADLQLAPPRDRSILPAILIAAAVLAAAAIALFVYIHHQTVSELRVTNEQIFAPHTEMTALKGGNTLKSSGLRVLGATGATAEDDLYVVTHIQLTDHLKIPLFITGAVAHVTFDDGQTVDSRMLSAHDLARLQTIFPQLSSMAVHPLADGDQVNPGVARDAAVVLPFPGRSADAWQHKRGDATLSIELRYQAPQVTRLP